MRQSVVDETGHGESTRRQRTRERLIDAAYEVFAEQGVHAAAIETIVERAGFTRGAFYSNFDSKEELFFALAERENALRIERLEQAIEDVRGRERAQELDRDGIARLVEGFLSTQSDDRRWCLVQSEFRLLAMRDREVASRYLAYQSDLEQQLARVLEEAADAVGLEFSIDVVEMTRLCVDVYESAMQDAILSAAPPEDRSAQRRAMAVLPSLIHHLTRPRPARR